VTKTTEEARSFIVAKIQSSFQGKEISVEAIEDSFDLFESGAFDSLAFVSLITSVEQHFGIELDFSEIDPAEFTTLGGLTAVIAASGI